MYEGNYPFHRFCSPGRVDDLAVLKALRTGELPSLRPPHRRYSHSTMPSELWDVLLDCWIFTPAQRPNIQRISRMVEHLSSKRIKTGDMVTMSTYGNIDVDLLHTMVRCSPSDGYTDYIGDVSFTADSKYIAFVAARSVIFYDVQSGTETLSVFPSGLDSTRFNIKVSS